MGTTRSFSGFKDTDTDTYASATWTANRAIESGADGKLAASAVTKTELSYLAGATSNIQAQLNGMGSYTLPTLAANIALQTNAAGGLANSSVTITELGYLSGATSNIQAQINGKQASGSPKLTVTTANMAASYNCVNTYADVVGCNMKIATANATITTTLNPESIDISVYGTLYFVSGASDTIVGYQIDGGAAIPVLHLGPASGVLNAFGATVPATISAAAGSHTVNLMVCGPTTGQFVVGANNGATGISIKQISWA